MPFHHTFSILAPGTARAFSRWVRHLGGIGFIPLGLIDSSVIPLPGSMDVLTIILAAKEPDLWAYYAVMATLGSVVGAYVTYRLARKGGEGTLRRSVSPALMKKANQLFSRWGFGAVAIPAVLPPPAPMVPFVLAAGAMKYSLKKFLVAMSLGRVVRYGLLAYFAARYGRRILGTLARYRGPILITLCAILALGIIAFLLVRISRRNRKTPRTAS